MKYQLISRSPSWLWHHRLPNVTTTEAQPWLKTRYRFLQQTPAVNETWIQPFGFYIGAWMTPSWVSYVISSWLLHAFRNYYESKHNPYFMWNKSSTYAITICKRSGSGRTQVMSLASINITLYMEFCLAISPYVKSMRNLIGSSNSLLNVKHAAWYVYMYYNSSVSVEEMQINMFNHYNLFLPWLKSTIP